MKKSYHSKIINAVYDHNPQALALSDGDINFTYSELAQEIKLLSQRITNFGCVAMMLKNSATWIIADLACIEANLTCVPLANFLSDEQINHIIFDAKINIILTDSPSRFSDKNFCKQIEEFTIANKIIYKITVENPIQQQFYNNIAKITYTSGSTGAPKGVCLTQENIEIVAQSLLQTLGQNLPQRHLSILPFAVLLENIAGSYVSLLAGAAIVIFDINYEPKNLIEIIGKTRPQSCILVPELLKLFLSLPCDFSSFSYIAVGGASVSEELLEAAKQLGLKVYQGYGLSESASVVAINTPQKNKIGSVGKILPHIKISFADDGEIILHNPLFSGYLGQNESTPSFATGDLGHLDEDGYLHILGRKKNILITSYGRNISADWLESKILGKSSILQAAVFGEAKPFVVAVIFTSNPTAAAKEIADLNCILPEFARIKSFILAQQPFSTTNNQLTGNGKIKREAIFMAYRQQIENQYC